MKKYLKALFDARHILKSLLLKEIKSRYAGSVLGPLWIIATPIYQIVLYTFVFSTILKVRFDEGGTSSFVLYLLAGLIPWLFFSEATLRGTSAFLENGNLIKKVKFPIEICVISSVCSTAITFTLYIFIYSIILILKGSFNLHTFVFIFIPFIVELFLILGLTLGLGSIAVFFRDIPQMLGMILNLLFFLTPIVYPANVIPENVRWLYIINPFYFLIEIYRNLMVRGVFPEPSFFIYPVVFSVIIFILGYSIFLKTKKAFVDVL